MQHKNKLRGFAILTAIFLLGVVAGHATAVWSLRRTIAVIDAKIAIVRQQCAPKPLRTF